MKGRCSGCGVLFEVQLVDREAMHRNVHDDGHPEASFHLFLLCPDCEGEEHP